MVNYLQDPRYDYHRTRYEAKKARGECVRNGCVHPAIKDRTLCEKHGRRSREYWTKTRAA